MSVTQTVLGQLQPAADMMVEAVTDPTAKAPDGVAEKANLVLSAIKWGSIMLIFGLLLATGGVAVAGNNGFGGGVSSKMKSHLATAVGGLIIVATAAQLVNWIVVDQAAS